MVLPLDEFLRIAKALADGRRFAILERIAASGDAACQHLCEQFPVSQPTMSHHLRVLVDVGLIEMRRDGQYVHYRLRAETVRAFTSTVESRLGTGWARTGRAPRRGREEGEPASSEAALRRNHAT
ncbi:MAG: regulatory protein ArsR [Geminicoccaceae bacterium]|jgi:ArsR family transcriptional regulator|nr:regulatory protein ArsR [Geminicoccaceae bacterium]